MSRQLTLSNGQLLVNLGSRGEVRDLYFPNAGLENHVGGNLWHRVGIYVDGQLSWFDAGDWEIVVESVDNALAGHIKALNRRLAVSVVLTDLVYNEKNIFLRKAVVKNLSTADGPREFKVFFCQQFEFYESHTAHTAYYDPISRTIIHYRNQRVFLINGEFEGRFFDDYSTGVFGSEGKEGTHRDAEDGVLAKNNIEHGSADSVIGLTTSLGPLEEKILYYWLAAGQSISEAIELNNYVVRKGPGHLVESTRDFWLAWVTRRQFSFHGLSDEVISLFNRSLLIIRGHVGTNGAIIASSDSGPRQGGKDTYAYVWPRDGAISALALSEAGDVNVARNFFAFCDRIISPQGYFMHKYSPDGSLGSSWHPWLVHGKVQLPIQEDGTALVIHSLWRYYKISKDLEFIESIYNSLIKKAADFMVLYRDDITGLPKSSYDLWEEKLGISTFTSASVYGALRAAANFARLLGKLKTEKLYLNVARQMRESIIKYLFDRERQYFSKMIRFDKGTVIRDSTIDASSIYGIVMFGVLLPDDERVLKTIAITEKSLKNEGGIGGLARYASDGYHRVSPSGPGNPWFISTLWSTQYHIESARDEKDMDKVKEVFEWCTSQATKSGLLSEQLHPTTGEQLSVSPLVWSHAEFVRTVIAYLDKLEALGICRACNLPY